MRRLLGTWLAALPLFAGAVLLSSFCGAQTVSPVVMEYRSYTTNGSFDLTNDSLQPLVVTVEPKSFSIDREGNGEFRPLDPGIHVSFSETSLRLPPRARHTIFYKASADTYPAWFSVYSMFHGLPKRNNMNVQLELPHTVYLLGNSKAGKPARGDLQFADLRVVDGTLRGSVRNVSSRFQRVSEMNVRQTGRSRVLAGGFPLLPGGSRDFSIKLADAFSIAKVQAKFAGDALSLEGEAEPSAPETPPVAVASLGH